VRAADAGEASMLRPFQRLIPIWSRHRSAGVDVLR